MINSPGMKSAFPAEGEAWAAPELSVADSTSAENGLLRVR